jgi:hypothetical protein
VRWERLFDELEGSLAHERLEERDALVEDLREGEWAQVSWSQVVDGSAEAELQVDDVGPVRGKVQFANRHVVHLSGQTTDHVIAASAVTSVSGTSRPAQPAPVVAEALGWGHVFRNLTAGALARLVTRGGMAIEGRIDVVGADFVRVLTAMGAVRVVPFAAIRMLTVVS